MRRLRYWIWRLKQRRAMRAARRSWITCHCVRCKRVIEEWPGGYKNVHRGPVCGICSNQLREKEKEEFVETFTAQRWEWDGRMSFIYKGETTQISTERWSPEPMEVIINYRDSEGTHFGEEYGEVIPNEVRPLFNCRSFRKKHSDPDPHRDEMIRLNPGRWDEFGAKDGLNRWIMRRVVDRIKAEPRMFNQSHWGHGIVPGDVDRFNKNEIPMDLIRFQFLHCGTPGCVAGHAFAELGVIMGKNELHSDGVFEKAAGIFGLSPYQAGIFFESEWPEVWWEEDGGPLEIKARYLYPEGTPSLDFPNDEQAIRVLKRMIDHGVVPCVTKRSAYG